MCVGKCKTLILPLSAKTTSLGAQKNSFQFLQQKKKNGKKAENKQKPSPACLDIRFQKPTVAVRWSIGWPAKSTFETAL